MDLRLNNPFVQPGESRKKGPFSITSTSDAQSSFPFPFKNSSIEESTLHISSEFHLVPYLPLQSKLPELLVKGYLQDHLPTALVLDLAQFELR